MDRPLKLLYVTNTPSFFLSHRLPLANAARAAGYRVEVATPIPAKADANVARIRDLGFTFHEIPLSRRGMGPLGELNALRAIRSLYRESRPDLVHLLTIKPVLYGTLAARSLPLRERPSIVATLTGLGYLYTSANPLVKLLRTAVDLAYRIGLSTHFGGDGAPHRPEVIFQNSEDLAWFRDHGLVRAGQEHLIQGSGVDLGRYPPTPDLDGPPRILLASRLLRSKGVGDFAEAAALVKREFPEATFVLAGPIDLENPDGVPEADIRRWQDQGLIEWIGPRDDMPEQHRQATLACLPSYYREGVPLFLLEAMASRRAIVTCDSPGCREVIQHEKTGLLVPPRSPAAVAAAIIRLIRDPELRNRLADTARDRAEASLSQEIVIQKTLRVYGLTGRFPR
jgi:glycosyltransferase involved in cell wall biosynthesis